jgi:MerR family redox-sensitive transcriptional activator SoxR
MAELSIGEVAERCGIAASAIRYYEREGLIGKAGRRGGRRVFAEAVLDELALVELAKSAGFTVAEIKQLLSGFKRSTPPSKRWQTLARVDWLVRARIVAECARSSRCGAGSVRAGLAG